MLLVQQTLQEEACERLALKEKEVLALQKSNDRHACTTRTAEKKKRDLVTEVRSGKIKIARLEKAVQKFQTAKIKEEDIYLEAEDNRCQFDESASALERGPWQKQLDGSYSPTYFRQIASLYSEGMSTAAVRNSLHSQFSKLLQADEFDIPSPTYCDKVRAAMAHVEQLNVALRIGRCKHILQIFHDGSSLNGTDNFCLSVHVEYHDGTREKLVCGVVVPAMVGPWKHSPHRINNNY
jgi:hypothetical protein